MRYISLRFALSFLVLILEGCGLPATVDPMLTEVWQASLNGRSYSRPVVVEDRVIVGSESGEVGAFSTADGTMLWSVTVGGGVASGFAVAEESVCFTDRSANLTCLDILTGEQSWSHSIGGEKQKDKWDYFLSTPTVHQARIFVGSGGGKVSAFDSSDGKVIWQVDVGDIIHGEPLVIDGKVIVGSFAGKVVALDEGSGARLWTFKTKGNESFKAGAVPGSVASNGSLVFFGSRDYHLYAISLQTGEQVWSYLSPSWIVARPLVTEDRIFVGNSEAPEMMSFDGETGALQWQSPVSLNIFGEAQRTGEGLIAVGSFDGRLRLFGSHDGRELAHYDTPLARLNRTKFFDSEEKVIIQGKYETFDDLLRQYDLFESELGAIIAPVTVSGDMIYLVSSAGALIAVRAS